MTIQGTGLATGLIQPSRYQERNSQSQQRAGDSMASMGASKDGQSAEAQDVNDTIIATTEKFLNSVDEMTAFIAQIRNRRDLEKRADFFSDPGLDYVLDDNAEEKVDALIQTIKGNAKTNSDLLMQHARRLFPDESCMLAALRALRRMRNFSLDELDVIDKALEQAEEEAEPKSTKAGINVALKARLYGKKLKMTPASVRSAYRDFIQSEEHELEIYEKWLVFYGTERRHIIIDFMEKAVLTDLEASDPSCNDAEFGYLLSKVSNIKCIRSGDVVFIGCVTRSNILTCYEKRVDKWLLFLLSVLHGPDEVYEGLIEIGGARLTLASAKERSEFLQSIYSAISKISEHIFIEVNDRNVLLANMRSLINDATQLENTRSLLQARTENITRE